MMDNRAVTIQQLFEDMPVSSFNSTFKPATDHKTVKSKSNVESKPGKAPTVHDALSKSTSGLSLSSFQPTDENGKKGKEKQRPRTSPGPSFRTGLKLTPAAALSMYKDKLTAQEQEEIKDYTFVYYMGLQADKLVPSEHSKMADVYDDDENFYRIKPRDHIAYRYEIVDKPNLGKGTFGQVIRAYDHKEQKQVALKLVRNDKIYLRQSREELRILSVLKRQDVDGAYNIVTLHEFFMFRNHMVISFELLGINLYQVLRRNSYRGLPISRILPIARAVLKCLELLTRNRIIHCDLKPENIMLRRTGDFSSIKVGDFGSSCYEQQQMYHYIQSRYYRAPEVMLGARYGPAIDMWSLGCILGELSTGAPIFVGSDELDQLSAVEELIGEIPPAMKSKDKRHRGLGKGRGPPGSRSLHGILAGDEQFKDFVKQILVWDPVMRPTPLEMQDHVWVKHNRTARASSSVNVDQNKKDSLRKKSSESDRKKS